jgi:ribosomal protein S24E
MNELLARRYVKKVMGYGIPKIMAKEIVEVAMSVSKRDIDKSINYAIDLTYGMGFSKKFAK